MMDPNSISEGSLTALHLITVVDDFIWGIPLMALLVGTGLYLTFRFGFVQIRGFKHAFQVIMGKYDDPNDPGEISHFQALCSALSGTIGLGNIIGVALAIILGGPGAVFWMWITATVGMASKFTSCTLAVHYRKIDETGETHGGPMHYITIGMGKKFKWLAVLFALFTIVAGLGIGNMFQAHNLVANVSGLVYPDTETIPAWFNLILGIIIAALVGSVILGGIKSIGKVVSRIVPFMCVFYLVTGLWIILRNFSMIDDAFRTIFYCAFHCPESITGGVLGGVIRQGVARGLFSNEAGLGSSAMAHSAAKTDEPVREGLVAMIEPFIDTIVICSITAIVIVITKGYEVTSDKAVLTSKSFEIGLGTAWGAKFVSVAVVFFALSTLITWSYYGDRAADYLFGKKAVVPYRLLYLGFIVLGSCRSIEEVRLFSDAMNGLMAIPNLIALIFMAPTVAMLTKDYFTRMKQQAQSNQ